MQVPGQNTTICSACKQAALPIVDLVGEVKFQCHLCPKGIWIDPAKK